jgi:regulator of replication initiation timing
MAASIHRTVDDNDNEDDDDFVDARELQHAAAAPPGSPTFRKRLGKSRSEKELRNVIEELHLENASLKEVLDKVSKRLHAFELNSQSSHLALAQSLRLQRPGSPLSSSGGGGGGAGGAKAAAVTAGTGTGDEALRRRNRELEEQISDMAKHMESLEKDNLKLQVTLEKYRERWEQLKANAKARRGNQEQAAEGESKK